MTLIVNFPVISADYTSLKSRITAEAGRRGLADPAPPAISANIRVQAAEFNAYRSSIITLNSVFTIPLPTLPGVKALNDLIVAADVALLSTNLALLEAIAVNPPPLQLSYSPWSTGGPGAAGCYPGCGGGFPPCGGNCNQLACYPRDFIPGFVVQTTGYAGGNPIIKTGTQTVSFTSAALLDWGWNLFYEINLSGVWVYAGLLAIHGPSGTGWSARAGSFPLTAPAASIVRFAAAAGQCFQNAVSSGQVTLNFPNV